MAVCNLYCEVCANRETLETKPDWAIRSALEGREETAAGPLLRLLSARLVNSSARTDGALRYVTDKAMVALFGGSRGRLIKWVCDDRKDVANVLSQLYPCRTVNKEPSGPTTRWRRSPPWASAAAPCPRRGMQPS